MGKLLLLRSQQNEIFELIKDASLDPFNFAWIEKPSIHKDNDGLIVSQLIYKNTNFFFQYDYKGKDHHHFQIFSPGEDKLLFSNFGGSWGYSINYTKEWLRYLKRELDQPDLWGELSKYEFKSEEDIDNSQFTIDQFTRLKTGIEEVRSHLLSNYGTTPEYVQIINSKMDFLIEAAKRQGKNDWVNTLIGVTATVAAALTLSPDRASILWGMIKTAVLGIVRLLNG